MWWITRPTAKARLCTARPRCPVAVSWATIENVTSVSYLSLEHASMTHTGPIMPGM
jgi:hypothetical protein